MNRDTSKDFTIAFRLDRESRDKLLKRFPPKHAEVNAFHITYEFGVPGDTPLPPQPRDIKVVGYHESAAGQVLVAEVDGEKMQQPRGDGKNRYYHLTLSLDRSQGVTPAHSDKIIRDIVESKGEDALRNLDQPISIKAKPVIKARHVVRRRNRQPAPRF